MQVSIIIGKKIFLKNMMMIHESYRNSKKILKKIVEIH
jgi:hypothetical protein